MPIRFLFISALVLAGVVHAQDTTFTYQGQLQSGGALFSGNANLEFTLYDSSSDGTVVAGPLARNDWPVSDGLFQVDLDFGTVFDGSNRWLEITINGMVLTPRHQVTPTPVAAFALDGNVGPQGESGPPGSNRQLEAPTALSHFGHGPSDARMPAVTVNTEGTIIITIHRESTNEIQVTHCSDPRCETAPFFQTIGTGTGPVAMLMTADGLPLIAWGQSDGISLYACTDSVCSNGTSTLASIPEGVRDLDIALFQHWPQPMIAVANGDGGLQAVHCDAVNCQGTNTVSDVLALPAGSDVTDVAVTTAMKYSTTVIIAYRDAVNGHIGKAECGNIACVHTATGFNAFQDSYPGSLAATTDVFGMPLIGYWGENDRLDIARCFDPECTGVATNVFPQTFTEPPPERSLEVLVDGAGLPRFIAMRDETVWLMSCMDPMCQQMGPRQRLNVGAPDEAAGMAATVTATGTPAFFWATTLGPGIQHSICPNLMCLGHYRP